MEITALITGASSGIGRELARVFAAHGYHLVLSGRKGERLEMLAQELREKHSSQVSVFDADLAQPDAPQRLYDTVAEAGITVDVLVNDAGFGDYGRFIEVPWERERELVAVNILAAMHLTHLFGNDMAKRGNGKILNLSSIAAFQPGPFMPVYYASKAFLLSFTVALAYEMRSMGVTVTALCPGATATDFESNARMRGSWMYSKLKNADPAEVARIGFEALDCGQVICIPYLHNCLAVTAARLLPVQLGALLAGVINRGS